MSPELLVGPMPDGMPVPMYLAFRESQDREERARAREARKRASKRR